MDPQDQADGGRAEHFLRNPDPPDRVSFSTEEAAGLALDSLKETLPMRLFRHSGCWLPALLVLVASATVRADTPPDPLRLVPEQADLVIKVEQPRQLMEAVTNLDLFKQVQALEAVRELYDSTNVRRAFQLLTYFEKELGVGRFELLDRLAGQGAVLAVQSDPKPGPAL